jgi:hypothetical protein
MTGDPRVLLNGAAVVIFAAVNTTALMLGPGHGQAPLFLCALFAVLAAVQCASWDPALLTWALAFSIPPVLAVTAADGTAWLIGLLGALLLLAAELNTLGWEYHGTPPAAPSTRNRIWKITQVAGGGAAAALAIGVVSRLPSPGGVVAVLAGAIALVGVGRLVFGIARPPQPDHHA